MGQKRDPSYLKVVGKAFHLVESLAQANSAVRLSDLARELRQPKATVYRILYTLGELGYVRQDPTSAAYQLSDKIAHPSRDEIKESLRGAPVHGEAPYSV